MNLKITTHEEKTRQAKLNELNNSKAESNTYLNDTAWIWQKHSRNVLSLQEMTQEEFNIKYKDIILLQEEARLNIKRCDEELSKLV